MFQWRFLCFLQGMTGVPGFGGADGIPVSGISSCTDFKCISYHLYHPLSVQGYTNSLIYDFVQYVAGILGKPATGRV